MNTTQQKHMLKSKKDLILWLFDSGVTVIETISAISDANPGYVESVLQAKGLIDNYFDLYTSTGNARNIYSKHFRGRLGFKNAESATRSIQVLGSGYRYFENQHDRPGQHHTLDLALTMLDRARWTGKLEEADLYRRWLVGKLSTPLLETSQPMTLAKPTAVKTAGDEMKKAA